MKRQKISIKLPSEDVRQLDRIAQRQGTTRTEVIRNILSRAQKAGKEDKNIERLADEIREIRGVISERDRVIKIAKYTSILLSAFVRRVVQNNAEAEKMIKEALVEAKGGIQNE